MANDVVFIKQQGGLGRPLPGEDYISGYLHYTASLPSGFSSSDRIKQIFSVEEAEDLGITDTHLGATASTATVAVTNKGATGDTAILTVAGSLGTVTLASYTQVAADVVSITTSGDRLALEINNGTLTHGYTALNAIGTVTITAPTSEGIFLNSGTPYVFTPTGTLAATVVQSVVAGVASEIDIIHYHISEYFRLQPKGNLYVGIYATADATTFESVTLMQNFAQGRIRQIGIYQKTTAWATSQCATLQAILTTNETNHKPLEAIYGAEISATALISTLTSVRLLSAPNVTVTIGQDGAGTGYQLFKATGKSIGCVGTCLGAVSFAAVNEDIAWPAKFNVSGEDFDTLNFANGQVYTALTDTLINTVDLYGYVFLKKHVGLDGSYFNDSHTAIALTNDYAYIEINRVYAKARRNLRAYYLPYLASPVKANADGTMSESSIGFFEGLGKNALDPMVKDNEISAYQILIDPSQNIVSTSKLVATAQIIAMGVARTIQINLGYVTAI